MNLDWRRFKKLHIIIAGSIVLVLIVFAAIIINRSNGSGAAYKQVTVERGNIEISVLSTGIVQPENRLEIKPPIAGRVEDIMVDEGQEVKKGQTLVHMSSSERAALLDAARAHGPEEFKRWDSFYRAAPILAPINGTIISRKAEPGQTFTTQDAILVMSDRLTVKAQVDETDIAQIKLNQNAAVILDAYPDDNIPAHVDKIAYDSTTISNVTTYIVDVLPEQTPDFMRSGMTANVKFDLDSKQGILVLPVNAVKTKEGLSFVTIPASSSIGTPTEKEIQTGISNGKLIEIISGLSEGDVVIAQKASRGNGSTGTSSPFTPFRAPKKN